MKQILNLLALTLALTARGQHYADRLQSAVSGQGTVRLHQDQRLTDLLNATTSVRQERDDEPDTDSAKAGVKRKVRGYRIQMYWGGSQRTDQLKAQRLGAQVSYAHPELRTYTSFESPHWRCRVGDFTTREEAAAYLSKLRRITNDAMIVRSEIYVYQ